LLGLLVAPHQMLEWVWPSLAIALTLMFVARPLAVWLCLKPLKFSHAECAFVGWVGLRGAVPIVLALFPLLAEIPDSWKFFNVAFFVVLLSLLMQGTTMGLVAKRLGVVEPPEAPPPEQRPVQGRLTIDANEPLADVFEFFQLPIPDNAGPTLADWLTDTLARGHDVGDGLDWHGAHFEISAMLDGHISRVGVAMLPKSSG
jgi:cell volume regulation protein A